MGLSCYGIRDRFSELLDEQLSPINRDGMLAHLAGCERCAGDYELFRKSQQLVANLLPLEVSAGFTERVLARVREQRPEDRELPWLPQSAVRPAPARILAFPRTWTSRAAAAAAVAALSLGMW